MMLILELTLFGVGMTQSNSNAPVGAKTFNMYKRGWRIVVVPREKFEQAGYNYKEDDAIVLSDSSFGRSALRCTFRVESAITVPRYGEVSIYNLSKATVNTLVNQGARVIIEAGYENGIYGTIWNGNIFHFIEHRDNVVDKVLTMHCMQPYDIYQNAFIMGHITQEENTAEGQFNVLTKLIQIKATGNAVLQKKSETSTRAATIFSCDAYRCLKSTADSVGGYVSIVDGTQNENITILDPYENNRGGKEIKITPESGLIGTPTTIPEGISFKCLLDPRLAHREPPMYIRISHSETKASPQRVGEQLPKFMNDGRYRLISVVHEGDTRGNTWYSECQAYVNPEMRAVGGLPTR